MSKTTDPKVTKPNANTASVLVRPGDNRDALLAQTYLRPTVQAASTVRAYNNSKEGNGPKIDALVAELSKQVDTVGGGDLRRLEAMLIAQAHSLDAIFGNLARRAICQEYLPQYETHLRLALKAQGQCRATLETLAAIKNPPSLAFVRQQNVAMNQQVNNESRARGEPLNRSNEVLENHNGERLDDQAQTLPSGFDSQVEAVGALHGPKNAPRKG